MPDAKFVMTRTFLVCASCIEKMVVQNDAKKSNSSEYLFCMRSPKRLLIDAYILSIFLSIPSEHNALLPICQCRHAGGGHCFSGKLPLVRRIVLG